MDPNAWPLLGLLAGLVALTAVLGLTWDALGRRRSSTLLNRKQTEDQARGRLDYWTHVGDSSNQ